MKKLIAVFVLSMLVIPVVASAFQPIVLTQLVRGCTDATAYNYDANANQDDGSCKYGGGQPFYGQLFFTTQGNYSNVNFATRVAGYIWVGQLVSMESDVTFGVAITPDNIVAEYQSNGNVYHSMMLPASYNANYVVVTAVIGNQTIQTILPIR